jgi:hypothetical protein
LVIDPRAAGAAIARRRVIDAWHPGATVHALDGRLVVRFARPRWIDCARAPGAALASVGNEPDALLAAAPLTARERAGIPREAGAIALVQDGLVQVARLVDAEVLDPATYLDVCAFAITEVQPLGPPPLEPASRIVAAQALTRARLGIGEAPPELASIVIALHAARARTASSSGAPASWLGAIFARLAGWFATLFALPSRASNVGHARGTAGSRALVVMPREPPGSALLARASVMLRELFAAALVRARLAPFLGRRQAEYIGRMMDMFERGDLDEALRHAIPLGAGNGDEGGDAAPLLGLPSPRDALAIVVGGDAARASIFTPEDFYVEIRRRYRAAFERLEREGRIEEAAFVLAELLRESAEAVSFLERHHEYRLAAELADARELPAPVRVRQWLLAGDPTRAVLLARRHGAFAEAVAALGDAPQASLLRLLWGQTLAETGDFAAAVDVVWPLAHARRIAAAWIEAGLAQGGTTGARMLARKLVLVPDAFDDVKQRVHALCDERTSTAEERRALALAWGASGAEGKAPGSRTLARPIVRAMVRDAGRSGDPELRGVVDRLLQVASDEALRADVPAWPSVTRTKLAERTSPRSLVVPATDHGATPIHDAACLPGGRIMLALGEAGVRVIDGRRHQRPRAPVVFAEPAHALVVSDRGDRALALARRGEAWRVARLDLIGGRSEPWCEARFEAAAGTFDGGTWVVASGSRLLVIDALEQRFEALASLDLGSEDARPCAIARSTDACTVVLGAGDDVRRCVYQLPAWTLRAQADAAPPRAYAHAPQGRPWFDLLAASGSGEAAIVASVASRDGRGASMASRFGELHVASAAEQRRVGLGSLGESSARPVALALNARYVAHAFQTALAPEGSVTVGLRDMAQLEIRAIVTLAGSSTASLRLDDRTLTVADDRGRVLVTDLEVGDIVAEARV